MAFVAALVMYVPSLPSQPASGDTAEYQTVPYILGIAHPTGFPAYTLAGWIVSHALAVGTVAWRMNAFAAVCTALTAAGVVLLAVELGAGTLAALAAGVLFAFGTVVWQGAVHATPHTLSGLCTVAALIRGVSFARSGHRRALYTACACAGFGLATQPETLFVLPAIALAAFWQRRILRLRMVAIAMALLIAPLLLYAYLPMRSAVVSAQHLDPTAAAPLDGAGSLDWNSHDPRTIAGFLDEVLGRNESAGTAIVQSFDPRGVVAAGRLWFDHASAQCDGLVLALAVLGMLALAQRDRRALSVVIAGTAGGLMFASVYRADIELYRYFLVASAATAALAGAATRLAIGRARPAQIAVVVTLALSLSAARTWYDHRGLVAELRFSPGRAIIDAVRRDVPDGSIVVAAWYDATTLEYAAAVEHRLGSRIVVNALPQVYATAYPAWARARRVVIVANWGTAANVTQLPAAWVHELPSTLPSYHDYEIVPPDMQRPR